MNYPVPTALRPYYDDALKSVHPLEVSAMHDLNRLAAGNRLQKYKAKVTNDPFAQATDNELDAFIAHEIAIERATNAYAKVMADRERQATMAQWVKDNTCPVCNEVTRLDFQANHGKPWDMGNACPKCHAVAQSVYLDSLKTAVRIERIRETLGL